MLSFFCFSKRLGKIVSSLMDLLLKQSILYLLIHKVSVDDIFLLLPLLFLLLPLFFLVSLEVLLVLVCLLKHQMVSKLFCFLCSNAQTVNFSFDMSIPTDIMFCLLSFFSFVVSTCTITLILTCDTDVLPNLLNRI